MLVSTFDEKNMIEIRSSTKYAIMQKNMLVSRHNMVILRASFDEMQAATRGVL